MKNQRESLSALIDDPVQLESVCPMLYCRNREVDDLLLQEVFLNMYAVSPQVRLSKFTEWKMLPKHVNYFNIAPSCPQIVAGALFVEGLFIFDDTPFVTSKVRDYRCVLELPLADDEVRLHPLPQELFTKVNETAAQPSAPAPMPPRTQRKNSKQVRKSISFPVGDSIVSESIPSSAQQELKHQSVRGVFRVREYEATGINMVVQTFQSMDHISNETKGRVFTRAFSPLVAPGINKDAYSQGVHPSSLGSASPIDGVPTIKRKPLPGEDKLRTVNPKLYLWCLERSAQELSAATTAVKALILYYKYTHNIVKTIKNITSSTRAIQRAFRRFLARSKAHAEKTADAWEVLERQMYLAACSYIPLPSDTIDALVNSILRTKLLVSREEKLSIIRETVSTRRIEYSRMSTERRMQLPHHYRLLISPEELMEISHKRLLHQLTHGESSIFKDPRLLTQIETEKRREMTAFEAGMPKTRGRARVQPIDKPTDSPVVSELYSRGYN
jgi:hypothetical protein